jgi:hypothetical protein
MVLLLERWETCDLVWAMASARKEVTKSMDPTGWPRTRSPSVTLHGVVAEGLVAVRAGLTEKVVI